MSNEWVKEALKLQARGDHVAALRACAATPAGERARFAAHTLRAFSLAALGQQAEARAQLRATSTLAAPPLEWCQRAVKVCRAVGELTLGRELVDRALDAGDPAAVPALLLLRGQLNGEQHLLRGAIEHAERVVAILPTDLDARLKLARLYCDTHLYELAAPELAAVLELEPQNVQAKLEWAIVQLDLGHGAAALRMLQGLGEERLSTSDQVRRSGLLWRSGALDEAKRAAEGTLRAAPQNREARLQCASFALWRGELGAAREHLTGLPEDDAGLSSIQASLAFVERDPAAALEHATRALALDRNQPDAAAVAVAALLRLDRIDEAKARASTLNQASGRFRVGVALVEASLMCRAYGDLNHTVLDAFELVAPIFGDARLDPAAEASRPRLLELLDGALDRLSGNFGPDATYLAGESREPRRLDTKQPARLACVRAADAIKARPLPWVVARVLALKDRYPESPLVHTHAAELHLWHGDYAACEAECRAALALSETFSRWAWVGLGAARMFQGHVQDALDVFAQSDRRMPPGGPLQAYRGEALRLSGELDAADRESRLALQANPNRVSAWINLALTAAARGDGEVARQLCFRLSARLPGLMQDVERDTLRSRGPGTAALQPVALLEALLRAMRGNRSSGTITYFLADGLARSATAQALHG